MSASKLVPVIGEAKEFNGTVNMRFDDTNPLKEDEEYVNSIKEDVQWLGFKWNNLYVTKKQVENKLTQAMMDAETAWKKLQGTKKSFFFRRSYTSNLVEI